MKAEYRLTQGEVAELVAAALGYNGHHCTDIAFDLSSGGLEVVATCETDPLRVRDKPEDGVGGMSWQSQLLSRMVVPSGN